MARTNVGVAPAEPARGWDSRIRPSGADAAVSPGERKGAAPGADGSRRLRIALVGAPNVGKSALFNRLTGAYVHVSNYPGTSIEVTRGHGSLDDRPLEVLDTPGLYSLLPTTDEERVSQAVVLGGEADVLVHVVDAKNLPRLLPLTLQLLEVGRPLVLALNMVDEAHRLGMHLHAAALSSRLGVPAIPVSALTGHGLSALRAALLDAASASAPPTPDVYDDGVADALWAVRSRLDGSYPVARQIVAALLLQGDPATEALVLARENGSGPGIVAEARAAAQAVGSAPVYRMAYERRRMAEGLLEGVVEGPDRSASGFADRLGGWLQRPWPGIPILLLVLYLGLYRFVGVFGAGTVVDWIESAVFEARLNPLFEWLFAGVPWEAVRSLFVGEYGVLTLGLRYAVAIVLPVVGAFFLFFSVLEDTGYFPRLALLVDRLFKRIGLSGRAVIPMVLGFACDTMATMVARTLETRREKVLATLLLALAVPCSAQLGVVLAVLAGHPAALGVWVASLLGTFLLVGALSARLLPGEAPVFHMELPPLRLPRPGNVMIKTVTRMHWYFLEVLPLFLLVSVLLWAGAMTGLLDRALAVLVPAVRLLGLPPETAQVFLLGFFRRDYGAAGLFELGRAGALGTAQLTVAAVTLTLFVPCVAQFLMMIKERGYRTALGIFFFITPFAFGVGFLLNLLLRGIGW